MKYILRIFAVIGFIALVGIVIAYGRGYRWNLKNKSLTPTGILSVNSNPNAAKIYLNGQLKGVTDTNLTLPPDTYKIEIKKDGYTSWMKTVKLQGELVYIVDTQLFPLNPSLSPLTNLGVVSAVPVDQTERIIIFSDNNDPLKDGIYLFEASKKPLSLLPPLKLLVLKKDLSNPDVDFNNPSVYFSPDYKEAIVNFASSQAYLLSLDGDNKNIFEVSTSKSTLIAAWDEERNKEVQKILEAFPEDFAKVASDSFKIISFSPDKNKVFYQSTIKEQLPLIIDPPLIAGNQTQENRDLTKNNYYIYDKKEDKNFLISNFALPAGRQEVQNPNFPQWYPDSAHLVFAENKKISVIDYDNTNKQTIYSGPFEGSFFINTADGKIVTLSNLNPENNQFPDLYLVGVR